jgi:hypothetical protein
MILADNEPPGFSQEIEFVADQGECGANGTYPRDEVTDIPRRTWICKAKPGKDQGDADPGEDDDLMDEFEGHG